MWGVVLKCQKLLGQDPKPVDLFLDRLKPFERGVEGRTGAEYQFARVIWE